MDIAEKIKKLNRRVIQLTDTLSVTISKATPITYDKAGLSALLAPAGSVQKEEAQKQLQKTFESLAAHEKIIAAFLCDCIVEPVVVADKHPTELKKGEVHYRDLSLWWGVLLDEIVKFSAEIGGADIHRFPEKQGSSDASGSDGKVLQPATIKID